LHYSFSQDDKYLFSFGIQIDKKGNMTLDEEKLKTAFKEFEFQKKINTYHLGKI
jgi:flagellar capping protein FliD